MENINLIVKEKINSLKSSNFTFEGLYNIIHNQGERIFCEYMKEYRISKITYKECDSLCKKTANYLTEKISDKAGSFVGIKMENSIEWSMSFWALLMAGYKPMLLNDRLPQSINQYICDKLDIKTIITKENSSFDIQNMNYINVSLKEMSTQEEIRFTNWQNEIAISTTATSLNVKICIYNGKNFTNQVLNTKKILSQNKMIKRHYEGSLKILTFLPFYHIFGLVAVYFWFSVFGRTFVFLKDYTPNTILNTVKMHKVTHIFAVPMLWHTIYKEITKQVSSMDEKTKSKFEKGIKLSLNLQSAFPNVGKKIAQSLFKEVQTKVFGDSIQFMISGGGYLKEDALKVINGIGYPLYNGYGMSEIGITSVELRSKAKYRIQGTIGKPFETVEYKIEEGKLLVKGTSLCSKIITENEVIELKENEWFDTKDMAKMDKTGSYYIEGRIDDVFIGENGEKINPDLIEMSIDIPSSKNYVVLGIETNNSQNLSLIVEIGKEYTSIKTKKVLDEIKKNLKMLSESNFNIERAYLTYDELANANAIKVSRNLLLRNINNGNVKLIDLSEFKEIEKKNIDDFQKDICGTIKKLMSEVLNIDSNKIKDDSHFIFDLGGTSLEYLTLLMEIKEKFEIDLKFENKSCSNALEFSEYIAEALNVKNMS